MKRLLLICSLIFPFFVLAQKESCNCCSLEQTAFDFWIGEWVVNDSNGNLAGYNTIVKEESGCVIKEKWISAKQVYTGTSINFYDKTSKNWEQLWVDNSGNILKLKGNLVGNQMILESEETLNVNGDYIINRITWTPNYDGTVRQLWQVLDENKNSTVVFDGLYNRKKL